MRVGVPVLASRLLFPTPHSHEPEHLLCREIAGLIAPVDRVSCALLCLLRLSSGESANQTRGLVNLPLDPIRPQQRIVSPHHSQWTPFLGNHLLQFYVKTHYPYLMFLGGCSSCLSSVVAPETARPRRRLGRLETKTCRPHSLLSPDPQARSR